jgi:hypothetical protein
MGYPYSDARYGSGLYSRRPDWWRDKACANDAWTGKTCPPLAWAPIVVRNPDDRPWLPAPSKAPA